MLIMGEHDIGVLVRQMFEMPRYLFREKNSEHKQIKTEKGLRRLDPATISWAPASPVILKL